MTVNPGNWLLKASKAATVKPWAPQIYRQPSDLPTTTNSPEVCEAFRGMRDGNTCVLTRTSMKVADSLIRYTATRKSIGMTSVCSWEIEW